MRKIVILFVLMSVIVVRPSNLFAQDSQNQNWYFNITPYLWLSNISGSESLGAEPGQTTIGHYVFHIDHPELFADLALRVELGKNRLKLWVNYSSGGIKNNTSAGDFYNHSSQTDIHYDLTWMNTELITAVQIGPYTQKFAFETFVGWRIARQIVDIIEPNAFTELNVMEQWSEPMIGARIYTTPGKRVWSIFNTDFGGLGIGSDNTWSLGGELGYRISKKLDTTIRYNYQEIQYNNDKAGTDRFIWDTGVQQGWLFGLVFRIAG